MVQYGRISKIYKPEREVGCCCCYCCMESEPYVNIDTSRQMDGEIDTVDSTGPSFLNMVYRLLD